LISDSKAVHNYGAAKAGLLLIGETVILVVERGKLGQLGK